MQLINKSQKQFKHIFISCLCFVFSVILWGGKMMRTFPQGLPAELKNGLREGGGRNIPTEHICFSNRLQTFEKHNMGFGLGGFSQPQRNVWSEIAFQGFGTKQTPEQRNVSHCPSNGMLKVFCCAVWACAKRTPKPTLAVRGGAPVQKNEA